MIKILGEKAKFLRVKEEKSILAFNIGIFDSYNVNSIKIKFLDMLTSIYQNQFFNLIEIRLFKNLLFGNPSTSCTGVKLYVSFLLYIVIKEFVHLLDLTSSYNVVGSSPVLWI